MRWVSKLFGRTTPTTKMAQVAEQPITFLPDGRIKDSDSHWFLRSIAKHWPEAKALLYNGSFSNSLKNGYRPDWEKHATTIVTLQPDQDVGLFSFAVAVSLSSNKHVNSWDMLEVAKAAVQVMSPISASRARIQQLLDAVPRTVRVYREDDNSNGFFYDQDNEAYKYLFSVLESS